MHILPRIAGLALGAASALLPAAAAAQASNNFSMVGFEIDLSDPKAYNDAITEIVAVCEVYELSGDNLSCMQQKENGGQIWLGLRFDGEAADVITANPAFVGNSRFPVIVEGRTSDAKWEPFEYQLSVTFSDFEIPLMVELADPRDAAQFAEDGPQRFAMLDLTAFVFEPEIFASADAFTKAQMGSETQLAADFFVPSGLFGDAPSARASFAGTVLEAELMTTEDGESHWRTLVEVLGGASVNVVFADAGLEAVPERGNLIVGDYWLSAQVISE